MDDPTLVRGIVIADDQTYLLDIVRNSFSECPYAFHFARNGRDALNFLDSRDNIAILVLDHVMDHATGLEVLKHVRTGRTAAPANLPVLLVTGYGDAEVVRLARALDVSSVLTKPVSLKTMSERLEHALSHPIAPRSQDAYEDIIVSPAHSAPSQARRSPGVVMSTSDAPLWRRRSAAPRKPFGTFQSDRTIWFRLENVRTGMVIAQDVRGPNGILIVAGGVRLTDRLIKRLTDHAHTMTELAFIKVYATPAVQGDDPNSDD